MKIRIEIEYEVDDSTWGSLRDNVWDSVNPAPALDNIPVPVANAVIAIQNLTGKQRSATFNENTYIIAECDQ